MRIEIPDEIIQEVRIIDAINSGRTTSGEKDLRRFQEKYEELHRLSYSVGDKVLSILLKEVVNSRNR